MIVIIHNPGWYSGIFEKNKMLESSASNDFSTYFSFDHCLVSYCDIVDSSLYETRHNNSSIPPFIKVEAIVGDGLRDDVRS